MTGVGKMVMDLITMLPSSSSGTYKCKRNEVAPEEIACCNESPADAPEELRIRRRSPKGPSLPEEMMQLVEAYTKRIAQRKRIEQESQNQKKNSERSGRRRITSCSIQ